MILTAFSNLREKKSDRIPHETDLPITLGPSDPIGALKGP
jgi:hypothetical protein